MSGFYTKSEGTGPGSSIHKGVDDQSSSNDDQLTITDSEVCVNEDGDDLDFRVEANALSGGEATHAIFVQGSDGNVGIGTSSPGSLLDVNDRVYITNDGIIMWGSAADYGKLTWDTGEAVITSQTDQRLTLRSHGDNTDRLTIATSGKVGIGITAPQKNLSVSGGGSDGTLQLTTTSNGTTATDGFQLACATSGAAVINQREAADLTIYVNGALAMTYQDGGNVGVGTSTPDANFQVTQPTAGIGTVTITSTTTCTGTGTEFLNTFKVGDNIILTTNAETRAITAIASDTVMTIAAATNVVASAYTLVGGDRFSVLGNGNVGIGKAAPPVLLTTAKSSSDNASATDATLSNSYIHLGAGGYGLGRYFLTTYGYSNNDAANPGAYAGALGAESAGFGKYHLVFGTRDATTDTLPTERMRIQTGGNVGIGTTAPGQLLDVNQGGGNMIADGYDNHSLAAYKENIDSAPGYLSNLVACSPKQWNPLPFISAEEIKAAVFEHFGEDVLVAEAVEAKEAVYETVQISAAIEADVEEGIEAQEAVYEEHLVSEAVGAKDKVYERQCPQWDAYFPESNSHRNKALYDMPEGEMKTWIDEWCETKRVGMRQEPKWQKKRIGLVADGEATAEHLPELIAHDSDGAPVGISTMPYIGMLHSAIIELAAKVEALENK